MADLITIVPDTSKGTFSYYAILDGHFHCMLEGDELAYLTIATNRFEQDKPELLQEARELKNEAEKGL